jgi:hypothetical protein
MNPKSLIGIAMLTAALIGPGPFARAQPALPAPSPAVAEAQKAFDAGDYRGVLQKSSQAMSLRESPLPAADRYALLMLRGESLLRLKERTYAIDAFEAASRAAGREQIKPAALAKADAQIISRSQGSVYRPANGGDGIDIVNPASRQKAMKAAFDDGMAEKLPAIKSALEGTQLPPMLALVPALGDLYVLESAATGGDPKKTTEILKSFGAHARALMGTELARVDKRIDNLSDLANSLISSDGVWASQIDRRGLWTPERNELSDLIDYTKQIRQAAQRGRQIALTFGVSGENWDPVIAEAGTVLDHGEELWNHRY